MSNKVKFQAIVKNGNNRGVGFIAIPTELIGNFKVGEQLKVTINSDVLIHAKVRIYGNLGFYIPYEVMHQHNLTNKSVEVKIENIDGFYTSIGDDGRIYIPQNVAEMHSLQHNDIIEIEGKVDGIKQTLYPMLNVRTKKNTSDYMCLFDSKKSRNFGVFNVVRKLGNYTIFGNSFDGICLGDIDDEKAIIYGGNHRPVIISKNIKLNDIAHYLGCYFADGTKRGNSWGICASTFEQANYYYKMHQFLVKDAKIVPNISFTDIENRNNTDLIDYLTDLWNKNVPSLSKNTKVRIIKSTSKPSLKTNRFGCLVMKENRQLTQIYYNRLLQFLFNEIKSKQNKELEIDFICGVLEGDGSVSPDHGHLTIAANNRELNTLKEMLNFAGLKYYIRTEGENKSMIHIGLLEIIRNIGMLKDKIFKYYPKRRKLLKERLLNTASVRFLLGEVDKTSNWLIGQFNQMKILDGEGNLTEFGVKIKNDLKEFLSE